MCLVRLVEEIRNSKSEISFDRDFFKWLQKDKEKKL
jgi:hypothetical protein